MYKIFYKAVPAEVMFNYNNYNDLGFDSGPQLIYFPRQGFSRSKRLQNQSIERQFRYLKTRLHQIRK